MSLVMAWGMTPMVRRAASAFSLTSYPAMNALPLVMSVCDRLVVLNLGQVIADGTPESVRSNPEVVTAYLGNEILKLSVPAGGIDNA